MTFRVGYGYGTACVTKMAPPKGTIQSRQLRKLQRKKAYFRQLGTPESTLEQISPDTPYAGSRFRIWDLYRAVQEDLQLPYFNVKIAYKGKTCLAVRTVLNTIKNELKKGGTVNIAGFGTFFTQTNAYGRTHAKFKASSVLRKAINEQ